MRIPNKRRFFRLWQQGLLGNRPRTWPDAATLERSGYRGTVTLRSAPGAHGTARHNVPVEEALRTAPPGTSFNEPVPDHLLVLQGEVMRSTRGLELTYSTERGTPMREAMRRSQKATGATALVLLRRHLWPSSLEDLYELLDLYPDAVIEFSAFEVHVGDQPHRNTLIWEVRNY